MMPIRFTKKNNKGITMVELLVVIAIMGVLVGMSTISYTLVSKTNVKKSTRFMDDCLNLCREKAMTIQAYQWNVRISGDSVSVVKCVNEDGTQNEIISSKSLPSKVNIYMIDNKGNTYSSNDIAISFKALSGEINSINYIDSYGNVNTVPSDVTFIKIVSAYKNKETSVTLYISTGKHQINY